MSETLVEDDSAYPASVTVPEDGDARNAASVVVGFQALANRFAYWKTKVVNAFITGGTIDLPGDSTTPLTILKGVIKFDNTGTSDDAGIKLRDGASGGVLIGPYSNAGSSGRQIKKITTGSPGTNQTVNPRFFDVVRYNPSAAIELAIVTDANYVLGEHVRVINVSAVGGRTITIKDPAAATIVVLPIANGTRVSWVDIIYDGTNWVECGSNM